MNRLMKKEVKKLVVGLLALTIALGPLTPTLTQANTLKQNDDSTSISQRLSDNEMKEIVGGKKVVRWIYKYYTVDVYVHTQVPADSAYQIEGYGKEGYGGYQRYSVTHFREGSYLAGKYTITGRTFWGTTVHVKAALSDPQRNVVALSKEDSAHFPRGGHSYERKDLSINYTPPSK